MVLEVVCVGVWVCGCVLGGRVKSNVYRIKLKHEVYLQRSCPAACLSSLLHILCTADAQEIYLCLGRVGGGGGGGGGKGKGGVEAGKGVGGTWK